MLKNYITWSNTISISALCFIISLYTSTSCASGLEESSFFKIQTFLTESYCAVWDFRPTQEFTACLIFLSLAILLYILGCCRSPDNRAGEHFMRFQKFCSNKPGSYLPSYCSNCFLFKFEQAKSLRSCARSNAHGLRFRDLFCIARP